MRSVIHFPNFVEHSLPLWILYQTSGMLREIFGQSLSMKDRFTKGFSGGSNILLKIVEWEKK